MCLQGQARSRAVESGAHESREGAGPPRGGGNGAMGLGNSRTLTGFGWHEGGLGHALRSLTE